MLKSTLQVKGDSSASGLRDRLAVEIVYQCYIVGKVDVSDADWSQRVHNDLEKAKWKMGTIGEI